MPSNPPPSDFGATPTQPPSPNGDGFVGLLPQTGRWLFGWLGTWFVLSALADTRSLNELAAALAVSIAIAATFVLGPEAAKGLGYSNGGS